VSGISALTRLAVQYDGLTLNLAGSLRNRIVPAHLAGSSLLMLCCPSRRFGRCSGFRRHPRMRERGLEQLVDVVRLLLRMDVSFVSMKTATPLNTTILFSTATASKRSVDSPHSINSLQAEKQASNTFTPVAKEASHSHLSRNEVGTTEVRTSARLRFPIRYLQA
jgi:hypothetical protein